MAAASEASQVRKAETTADHALESPLHKAHESSSAVKRTGDLGVVEHSPPDFWEGSRLPEWLQRCLTQAFVFAIVHYTFWFLPAFAVLLALAHSGRAWLAALLVAAYVPSFLDGSQCSANGKQWEPFRRLRVWNLIACNCLGIKMLREAPLGATADGNKYVFGYHPHGVLVLSRFALFGGNWETLFPGLEFRFLGASTIFSVPFCRDASLWLGAVDASRATAEKVLASGKSITVYPGGIREMFCVDPATKETVLVLKNRTGFLKLAMQSGAALVPVVVFNEKYLYHVWRPRESLVDFCRRTFTVPLMAFWGRLLWMPLALPKDKTFGVVFGKPLAVRHTQNPTKEEVEALQSEYVGEVERLFAQYKSEFGLDDDETLVME